MREPARIPPIYLQGLDPEARYTVEGFDEVRSGQAWMNIGLRIPLGNFESTVSAHQARLNHMSDNPCKSIGIDLFLQYTYQCTALRSPSYKGSLRISVLFV